MYGEDVLAGNWRRRKVIPEVDAEPDLVVEDADSGFCGAVVGFELLGVSVGIVEPLAVKDDGGAMAFGLRDLYRRGADGHDDRHRDA